MLRSKNHWMIKKTSLDDSRASDQRYFKGQFTQMRVWVLQAFDYASMFPFVTELRFVEAA